MSERDDFEAWWQRGEWNVAAKDLAWKDMCRMAFNAGRDPQAERDALRADAERWKWAKHQGSIQDAIDSLVGDTVTIPEMEAAIDTAIAADGAQS